MKSEDSEDLGVNDDRVVEYDPYAWTDDPRWFKVVCGIVALVILGAVLAEILTR